MKQKGWTTLRTMMQKGYDATPTICVGGAGPTNAAIRNTLRSYVDAKAAKLCSCVAARMRSSIAGNAITVNDTKGMMDDANDAPEDGARANDERTSEGWRGRWVVTTSQNISLRTVLSQDIVTTQQNRKRTLRPPSKSGKQHCLSVKKNVLGILCSTVRRGPFASGDRDSGATEIQRVHVQCTGRAQQNRGCSTVPRDRDTVSAIRTSDARAGSSSWEDGSMDGFGWVGGWMGGYELEHNTRPNVGGILPKEQLP